MGFELAYDFEDTPINLGDTVSVTHEFKGKQLGTVTRSRFNFDGKQVVEVLLENEVYQSWYPVSRVKHVRRTIAPPNPLRARTVERRIYW